MSNDIGPWIGLFELIYWRKPFRDYFGEPMKTAYEMSISRFHLFSALQDNL